MLVVNTVHSMGINPTLDKKKKVTQLGFCENYFEVQRFV